MHWQRFLATIALGSAVSVLSLSVAAQPARTIRIDASAGTVSTFTETTAGDHLIPDSQVFVGGRGGASRWFGLLGVAIDAGKNAAVAGDAASALRVKFDATVVKALKALESQNSLPEARLVLSSDPYDLKLLPSARFNMHDDSQADLSLRVTARIRNAGREETRNYYYAVSGLRPLVGAGSWTENNGESFRTQSEAGIERLTEAVVQDAAGRFSEARTPDKQRKIKVTFLATGLTVDAVLLGQTEQTLIVIPVLRDRPMTALVQVFDRGAVKTEAP